MALDLHDTGVRIMRQNLVRQHPGSSDEEIDQLLAVWMRSRPADAPGRPSRRISG
ncbi:MAG: hypothetical protein WD646_04210 [Actinomycetota bacterium]